MESESAPDMQRLSDKGLALPRLPDMNDDELKGDGKIEDFCDDDLASTCAPASVGAWSSESTPLSGPREGPFDDEGRVRACSLLDGSLDASSSDVADEGFEREKQFDVCIVHHDEMQLHTPPRAVGIYELPRRVIAIENSLKGLRVDDGFPRRSWGNASMRFLRAPYGKKLVEAYGSPACKRQRLQAAHRTGEAAADSAWRACKIFEAPTVEDSDLLLVHTKRHLRRVNELCGMAASTGAAFFPLDRTFQRAPRTKPSKLLNDDIYYSPQSLKAMRRAAGGAVAAVRELFEVDAATGRACGRSCRRASFAIVRPPGHHCCGQPNGFCFFNNTAIAASHARSVLGLKRVAIVDWDYHHGDGQQRLFYRDPSVLTISLHVALERGGRGGDTMAFPGNEDMDLIYNGRGRGYGYNINIPWPHNRAGVASYDEAFRTIVVPALRGFDPELILVASGFDAAQGDTLAGTRLPTRSYFDMTLQLLDLGKPLAVILEGGYSPDLLAAASLSVVHALLGRPPPASAEKEEPVGASSAAEEEDEEDEEEADGDDEEGESESGSDETTASSSSSEESTSAGTDVSECSFDREASRILDAVRRRLNKLPPWSSKRGKGGAAYFHEDPSPGAAAASRAAALSLRERIRQDSD
eukprot:TRINITY_DN17146_c0_g1_i1.p1 TRINITY_DN17146_c0_g1~~TRINITY_DN17146_c0_g1_i1.p1  ORF type:complete len:653 (-),score=151.97 TRINITY_DN17146_c0_g1_i1:156-2075(-)